RDDDFSVTCTALPHTIRKSLLAIARVRRHTSYPSGLPLSFVLPSMVVIVSAATASTIPMCCQLYADLGIRNTYPGLIDANSAAVLGRRNVPAASAFPAR